MKQVPATSEKSNRFSIRTMAAGSSLRGIGLASTNILLAGMFLAFAYAQGKSFIEEPRLSVFLIVVTETIVAVLLLIRRDPDETWHSFATWFTTTCGTLSPLLLRPIDGAEDLVTGGILQVAGFAIQIMALLALNRSIGLLPAYRGVKCGGLYSWVRHPLYTAYVITFVGYLINNQSLYNAVVVFVGTAFLVARIYYEEALLLKYDDYTHYAKQTRWRLIPAVW